MQERKINNLVVLALAGSILISAILVSMNQVNSARLRNSSPTPTTEASNVGSSSIEYVKLQKQINDIQSQLNSYTKCSEENFTSLSFWFNFERNKPIIVRCS